MTKKKIAKVDAKKTRKAVTPREPSSRLPGAPPKPWEKQDDEKPEDFQLFRSYRDMQGRTLAGVARLHGVGVNKIEKLSGKKGWVERSLAWDKELDRRVRDLQTHEIAEMRKRQIGIGIGMQTAAAKELKAWVAKIEEAEAKAKAAGLKYHEPILSINDLTKLVQHGTGLERLNRGEPTEHSVVESNPTDLSTLSTKELKQLKQIKEKLKNLG